MKFLLNEREQRAAQWCLDEYARRFGRDGKHDPDLVVHLGDNPASYLCWSGHSGRLPTFRTGSGKYYSPFREAWMLPRDKLAALGLPVTPSMARQMSVPGLEVADSLRAASIAGNSFHFGNVAVVHLVALSCFAYIRDEPDH